MDLQTTSDLRSHDSEGGYISLKFLLIFHQNSPLPPLRHAWPLLAWGRGWEIFRWEIFLTSNLEKDGWFLFMNSWFLYNIWSKENICAYDIIYIIHIYTKSFILFLVGQMVRLASCSNTITVLFKIYRWFLSIELLISDVTNPDMTNHIWNIFTNKTRFYICFFVQEIGVILFVVKNIFCIIQKYKNYIESELYNEHTANHNPVYLLLSLHLSSSATTQTLQSFTNVPHRVKTVTWLAALRHFRPHRLSKEVTAHPYSPRNPYERNPFTACW